MTKRNATVVEVKARIAKLTQQRDEARQQVRILENAYRHQMPGWTLWGERKNGPDPPT